jgi:hypothetical protein
MKRRTIALFFLLIPSIIILAHAVIPHYCDHILPLHENNETDAHHDSESCLLSQVYVKINREEQLFQSVDFNLSFNSFGCLLFLLPVNPVARMMDLNHLPFRQKPYILLEHIKYLSHSLGLRAPPMY